MMLELIYIGVFIFTFLYSTWRSAARHKLHDPLEWVATVYFSICWPLTWFIVLIVYVGLNFIGRKTK